MGDFDSAVMNLRSTRLRTSCIGLLAVSWLLNAGAIANPYDAIGERNIFGLKDPPPDVPPDVAEEPEPPLNIKVTGITTIQGIPRVLLKVQTPAKPPEPARELSYILVAGGLGKDGVEVLAIDESYGKDKEVRVKVRSGGKDSWLPLEKDTAIIAAAPAPAAATGPGGVAQTPAQRLAAARLAAANPQNTSTPNSVSPNLPTRPVRTVQPGAYPGSIPGTTSGALNLGAANTSPKYVARDYGLNREEQVILIEANRLVDEPGMPPLPPTELTPPELDPTTPAPTFDDPLNQLLHDFQE